MLTIDDLNKITFITKPYDIDLKVLADFYMDKVCSNLYTYVLDDDTRILLKFDETNLCHLMGIHKYNNDPTLEHDYEGIGGFNNIQTGKLTMNKLMVNKDAFGQYKNRILYFPFLPILLSSPSLIYFDKTKVDGKCLINASVTFYKQYEGSKFRIHLFADTENNIKYYPVTFIVHKNDKYIDGQTPLSVKHIDITPMNKLDSETKQLIAAGLQ